MKERLMVRGSKYWIADKEENILVSYHNSRDEARAALKALEKQEREDGYYVPYFYKIVEGVLGALRLQGYTALDDCWTCSEL